MSDRVVWFDLPSEDLERAMRFYAAVLDTEMSETYPGVSVIPSIDGGIHGCGVPGADDVFTHTLQHLQHIRSGGD